MGKRNTRRDAIEAAFEHLRSKVASALGAAERNIAQANSRHARQEHALHIAHHGVHAIEQDPSLAPTGDDPAFREAFDEAVAARDQAFASWTTDGAEQLGELVATSAPGCASAPWQEWLGDHGTGHDGGPGLWRIGTATVPESPTTAQSPASAEFPATAQFPAAVPLLDESHLRVDVKHDSHGTPAPGTKQAAETLVQSLLIRVLSYYQPGLVRIHAWDGARLTGTLPDLHPLTHAGLLTTHDPTRLDELLDELAGHIRRIHTDYLLGSHTSLRALAEQTGQRSEPWRIAVLFGDGETLKEEQQQQLQRIARNGLACGIQLIVVDLPMTVNSAIESIRLTTPDELRSSMTGPHAVVRPDPAPPRDQLTRACAAMAESFTAKRTRVRTFDDLVPDQLWTHRSTSGLQAPVGFNDGDPVWITLADTSPHTLVGGPSGSGKTNFLYCMLGSLAARYSPDELELYLLDFKEGVSFKQFTPGRRDPSWLAHAKLVGVNVNTDREFGLALLRFLAEEMRRRADAAKAYEVTKLEDLRAADPDGRWPRIVAVVDEFQYLFAERDSVSAQAAALLEDVARRGRSQGIHLVLASQDVSGIEAFWGKPAIFEQFIMRIALPKARRVLVDTNFAALQLPRWHAVVNHESGVKHGNEIARIPDAFPRSDSDGASGFDSLQQRLWRRHVGAEHAEMEQAQEPAPPRLFDGSHLPRLSSLPDFDRLRVSASGAPQMLLGQVIDVDGTAASVRLARTPGRNIAVLGSAVPDAARVLASGTLSMARQFAAGEIVFTVAGLVDEADADVRALVSALRSGGHNVEHAGLDDVDDSVHHLAGIVDERTAGADSSVTHCLVLHGADAAHPRLERKGSRGISGQERLRAILKQGPESRVHTLGWWRSAQRLRNAIGMGPVDDIGAWVAFDVHGTDLTALAAGQAVQWSPRAQRGLFFDRSVHSRPEVILPFDNSEALERSTEATGE